MSAKIHRIEDIQQDNPVAKLARRKLEGAQMLWAYVNLEAGCHVATHSHDSEQIGFVISGKILWRLGEEGTADYHEEIVTGGAVVVLPSNYPHGVEAIEDTVILDVLSPPGLMGVDRQNN